MAANDKYSQENRRAYRHDGHGDIACQEDRPRHTTRISHRVAVDKPIVTLAAGFFLADSVSTPQRVNAVVNTCGVGQRLVVILRPSAEMQDQEARKQVLLGAVLACVGSCSKRDQLTGSKYVHELDLLCLLGHSSLEHNMYI